MCCSEAHLTSVLAAESEDEKEKNSLLFFLPIIWHGPSSDMNTGRVKAPDNIHEGEEEEEAASVVKTQLKQEWRTHDV